MVRNWKLATTGTALLATTFLVVACSSKGDDDSTGGTGGTGAKGGTGASGGTAPNAGHGGSGTGGSTGGTGGSTGGTGGSTGGTGGSTGGTTGGSAGTGTSGSAGAATGGMGGATGFTCAMQPATCSTIHTWTFNTTSQWQGTYTYQESTVMSDKTTDPTKLHITGMVKTYDGFGIYTGKCSSLSGYTGVTFTLKGTTGSVDKPNTVKFVVQINPDEPIDTMTSKGACSGASGVDCVSPNKVITTSDSPQTIMFSDLAGGKPVATVDLTQVLGLQWQIDPDASGTAFPIDLTLSDVTLIGTPEGDCSAGASGGMGGMGAGGASSGGASSGGASSGGASSGGANSGGMAGATGGRGGNGAGGAAAGGGGRGGGRGGQGGA